MKKTAAFFDIDGTLYRDSLMVEHFKKLIKYDIIDQKAWYEHARDTFMDWDKRQGNYDDYLDDVCELYVSSLIGLDKTCIDFTSDQVIKLKSDRVYKYTRSRIKWHLDNNHIVIFISGSPNFLVEKMASKYNVTDFIGSDYVFENEIFNGTVIPMWDSSSKNTAIDEFVKKYNVDLSTSFAYGDTNGDINMLRRVGNPIAINPTKELINHIANDEKISKCTKIIVERKDIVYSLSSNVDILDI
ncbi:HAD-IB family hydrolase [Romboutsia sedimentorum]|uniref:phosphoserine phosphatase n=1 Tax=Romboutsia sedimentorum TaxID=1368474 RepID=A0ABT7EBK5_9FIRM|nr:HAD-IB family hydrolase [Romboutsia sedimentorum]MDK2564309.1 HAD-IB family hydrolase [Romboutsia sedimentorum]MDK2587027.1 HAD-IB family hydrolase [Romboutsia sedimentorum]